MDLQEAISFLPGTQSGGIARPHEKERGPIQLCHAMSCLGFEPPSAPSARRRTGTRHGSKAPAASAARGMGRLGFNCRVRVISKNPCQLSGPQFYGAHHLACPDSTTTASVSPAAGWLQRWGAGSGLKVVWPQGHLRLHGRKAFAKCFRTAVFMLDLAAKKQNAPQKAPAGGGRTVTSVHRGSVTLHTWKTRSKVLAPALL